MLAFIRGNVLAVESGAVIIETASGLGYEVRVTPVTASQCQTGAPAVFFAYLKVSEQAQELYGFVNLAEREFFLQLLTVSGIGPKTALNILSLGSIADIQAAIARGDVNYLTTVQGMGRKTAERVVVELKSKVKSLKSQVDGSHESDPLGDVADGLMAMGYSREEAREVVQSLERESKNSETLLREALQALSRKI